MHVRHIQAVVGLLFFSPVTAENALKGFRVLFVFQVHELREPAVGTGNVEILFTRHLKYGRDLRMEGSMARIVHMGIALNRVRAMPGICDGCLRGVRKIAGGSGGQEVMFAFSLKMSGSFPYEGRLGVGEMRAVIARHIGVIRCQIRADRLTVNPLEVIVGLSVLGYRQVKIAGAHIQRL